MGDPHLGRRFITGVPLHRRGEREQRIWADFEASLMNVDGAAVHVCMGDLFDKAVVPLDVILRAARAYQHASERNPNTYYVVLRGNHDAGGDDDQVTAFTMFRALVGHISNVRIVEYEPVSMEIGRFTGLLFVPWRRDITSAEAVEPFKLPYDAAFGHWDVHSFGNERNLAPTAALAGRCPLVVTGHDHIPCDIERNGVRLLGTGSLQPYTHGEDPTGKIYRTVSVAEAVAIRPELVRDLCLRVILQEGEVLPEIDCLQLTGVAANDVSQMAFGEIPDIGELDMSTLWRTTMAECGVDEDLAADLMTMYRTREVA